MNTKAVLARITGRVQCVGFRAWTRRTAVGLGLRGWVRNEADGTVSAMLAGGIDDIDEMIRCLSKGPPGARVETVDAEPVLFDQAPVSFEVRS